MRKTRDSAVRVLRALAAAGVMAAGGSAAAQEGGDRPARYGAFNPPPFAEADRNRNGVLEAAEVHAFGIPFNRLDTNNDGYVTRPEYSTGTAQYAVPDADELDPDRQASKE